MSTKAGRPPIDRDAVYNYITRGGVPGIVYISPIRISNELGISGRSLRRMLREFEQEGKLELKRREGSRALVYEVPQ